MMTQAEMHHLFAIGQLFVKRKILGALALLVAKLNDNFLIVGNANAADDSLKLRERFTARKSIAGIYLKFGGCDMRMHEAGGISISSDSFWNRTKPICMTCTRGKGSETKKTLRDDARAQFIRKRSDGDYFY